MRCTNLYKNVTSVNQNQIIQPLHRKKFQNIQIFKHSKREFYVSVVHKTKWWFGCPRRPMHSRLSPDISSGDLATLRPHSCSRTATSQSQPRSLPVPLLIAVTSRNDKTLNVRNVKTVQKSFRCQRKATLFVFSGFGSVSCACACLFQVGGGKYAFSRSTLEIDVHCCFQTRLVHVYVLRLRILHCFGAERQFVGSLATVELQAPIV